jgi:hypothetical protein
MKKNMLTSNEPAKRPGRKPSGERGTVERFYADKEAREILGVLIVEQGMNLSNVVCALIRAAGGRPPRPNEVTIYTQLKRVFGREQFHAFLKSVGEALPEKAEQIHRTSEKPESPADAWKIAGCGVVAFFNPSEQNIGQLFALAAKPQEQNGFAKVVVAVPLAEAAPKGHRDAMEAANIHIVSISNLREFLAEKPTTKKPITRRQKK